jgi:hypothetical protein
MNPTNQDTTRIGEHAVSDRLIDTKYGLWRVKERAISKVEALAAILGISFQRAVEVAIEESREI